MAIALVQQPRIMAGIAVPTASTFTITKPAILLPDVLGGRLPGERPLQGRPANRPTAIAEPIQGLAIATDGRRACAMVIVLMTTTHGSVIQRIQASAVAAIVKPTHG